MNAQSTLLAQRAAAVIHAANRRGYSLRDLAVSSGLSPSTVAAVRDGRRVRDATLRKLLTCPLSSTTTDTEACHRLLDQLHKAGWSRRKLLAFCGSDLRVRGSSVAVGRSHRIFQVAAELGLRVDPEGNVVTPPLSPERAARLAVVHGN